MWIVLGLEHYPFGLLTMIVSLEAIFLSTFVMISHNRADEERQVIANQQWQTVQEEEKQNERLLGLSNEILDLTKDIHAASATVTSPSSPRASEQPHLACQGRPIREFVPVLVEREVVEVLKQAARKPVIPFHSSRHRETQQA